MSSEGDLAARLHSWAVKEMHFYCQGITSQTSLPTAEDFKVLCKGNNAAVWKWVIGHVQSLETVKTVKGNLALKRTTTPHQHKVKYGDKESQYEQTVSDLQDRRAALSGEITATLRDIGHLEHEIERITSEITETEHNYEKEKDDINNTRHKSALLQAYCQKCSDIVTQYGEYRKCVDARVTAIKQRAQKNSEREEYYSRETTDLEEDCESSALETASAKHVRECCQDIGSFLHNTLKGAYSGDKTQFTKGKEPLWNKVEDVCGTYSADQILTGLVTLTRDTTAAVKMMTSRVDFRRDAQALRFKYESSGEVTDLAKPPSLLRSVHQLQQERGTEHLQRFILTQKYQNEARNFEESIAALKAQIEKRLQKLFSQKPTDFTVARKLIDAELELDGCRASLHCLSQQAESLKEMIESSYRERQELFAKYHRIQEFQQLTDKKQNVIQVLVKQNINSQSRLDAQIEEIKQYIERSLMSYQSQVGSVSTKLNDCVVSEVNDFANLALPYLMFSQIDNALKTAVIDLSIHQTSPSNLRPAMVTVLECLKFPSFQAPEMVLRQCVHLKEDIEEIVHRLDREAWQQQRRRDRDGGGKNLVEVIADLCETMREEDERQMKKTLPLLQERINKTANALSNCLHAKDAATAWWEQPGQSCVPWIMVDGHNLQYYLDRWTVLATNLRQILVK